MPGIELHREEQAVVARIRADINDGCAGRYKVAKPVELQCLVVFSGPVVPLDRITFEVDAEDHRLVVDAAVDQLKLSGLKRLSGVQFFQNTPDFGRHSAASAGAP